MPSLPTDRFVGLNQASGPFVRQELIELLKGSGREQRSDFRIERGSPAAGHILRNDIVQVWVADHYHVFVSLGHDARSETVMRVTIDDRLNRLLAECANGLKKLLTVFLGIAGVEDNEPFLSLNHNAREMR